MDDPKKLKFATVTEDVGIAIEMDNVTSDSATDRLNAEIDQRTNSYNDAFDAQATKEKHVYTPFPKRGSEISKNDTVEFDKAFAMASAIMTTSIGEVLPEVTNPKIKCARGTIADHSHFMHAASFIMELMEISPTPVGLAFENLSISIPVDRETDIKTIPMMIKAQVKKLFNVFSPDRGTVRILDGLTGTIAPGEMVLIIGPAGSGVSTLMKVLAGRYAESEVFVKGDLFYGGQQRPDFDMKPPKNITNEIGFCYEDDIHIPELTVDQALTFVSEMRMPQNVSKEENPRANELFKRNHKKFVQSITKIQEQMLGIDNVGSTVVGDELLRGVSGGQKKRVTIGETMAAHNTLNFLDGYTKGLDSATALGIAQALRESCKALQGGTTFVCSQYQASDEIFRTFDKVMVLQNDDSGGGQHKPSRCIYFGSTDSTVLQTYFSSIGFAKPDQWSWPDFLGTLGFDTGRRRLSNAESRRSSILGRVPSSTRDFAEAFEFNKLGQDNKLLVRTNDHTLARHSTTTTLESEVTSDYWKKMESKPYMKGNLYQFYFVLMHEWQILKARRKIAMAQIAGNTMFGIIIGTLWLNLGTDMKDGFLRQSMLNQAVSLASLNTFLALPQLIGDRAVMYRHTENHLYAGRMFFLAKTLIDIPVIIVGSLMFSIGSVFLVGLQSDGDHFAMYFVVFAMLQLATGSFLRFLVLWATDLFDAYIRSFFGLVTLLNLNGFLIPMADVGWWFRWICYLSQFQWAFKAFVLNEFDDDLQLTLDITLPNGTVSQIKPFTPENYRREIINVNEPPSYKWVCVGYMFAIFSFWTIAGAWAADYVRVGSGRMKLRFKPEKGSDHIKHILSKPFKKARDFHHRMSTQMKARKSKRSTTDTIVDIEQQEEVGAYFSFENLSYIVDVPPSDKLPDGKLQLLTEVNGYATPGMMVALMGTSGAGKTTLLDVLARRKTSGTIRGKILVNGVLQDENFSRICGYVEQTDNHITRSTVREALTFAARLRRSPDEDDYEIKKVVDDVLAELKLTEIADALIGSKSLGMGISPEALKRVTIGVELVADPKIIFMDEPTSGLDTAGALTVARVARDIANSGRVVICTIHQPSQMVLEMFDYMLLMQRGGRTVYLGEIGEHSKLLTGYFERGGAPPCPPDANPAEYMLDCVSPATGNAMQDWTTDCWLKSEEYNTVCSKVANNATALVPEGTPPLRFASRTAAAMSTQFTMLMKRQFLSQQRDPNMVGLFLCALYPALLTGALFVGTLTDDQKGMRFTQTALFAAMAFAPMFFIFLSLPMCYEDRAAFYRESSSGIYSKWLYAVSQQIAILPVLAVAAMINVGVGYYFIGFREGGFGYFYVNFLFYMITGWFQGNAVGAATSAVPIGTSVVTSPLMLSMMFCGFLVGRDDIGWWFRWLYYFNPLGLTYAIQGSFQNEFEPRNFTCSAPSDVCTGVEVLDNLNWNPNVDNNLNKWENLAVQFGFMMMWAIVTQILLVKVRHGSR
eukprot:m.68672 g.68672  ORF g.68672 m.68672 type:complete len:1487 (-) comp23981_c0_seq2:64-4524(-)